MKSLTRVFVVGALFLLTTSFAFGQWTSAAPRDGACFFTDYNFRGESFCVTSGQSVNAVPSNFNDRIRSIRVFGRTQVRFFNGANFSGVSGSTSRDISDLRSYTVPDDRGKNWAARISSIQVGGGGYGSGGRDDDRGGWRRDRDHDRDGDRDHDRDRDRDRDDRWRGGSTTVSCSADKRGVKQWCQTPRRISSVKLINENGSRRCEYNRSYGIDDGRLWTSHGCSGTFEIH